MVANGIVYIGSSDGNIYGLDVTDGHKVHTLRMDTLDTPSFLSGSGGFIYAGSGVGGIYAFEV